MKRSRIRIILSLAVVLLLTNVVAAQTVIYVDADAPGDNDGTSWLHAFRDLQDALAAGLPGDEIRVAQGEYKPAGADGDRDAAFHLSSGVALLGGYAGYGEPDPDARDIAAYETILSGDLNGDDAADFTNNTENAYHVVVAWSVDETAILEGFTVRGGNADGDQMGNRHSGGGLLNMGGSPTVTACTLQGNQADYGAGMTNIAGAPTVRVCTFRDNHVTTWDAFGGGVLNIAGSPTFINCLLQDNSADFGGGMTNILGSSPTLDGCVFRNNVSPRRGGGLGNLQCSPTLLNCTFENNTAYNGWLGRGGGGIYSEQSDSVLTGCVFVGNEAGPKGGGLCSWCSLSTVLTNCTFTENTARRGGGAHVYNGMGEVLITGCVFTDNTTEDSGGGGGLACETEGGFSLVDCTFTGNVATGGGGGLHYITEGEAVIANCVFTDNEAQNSPGGAAYGGWRDAGATFTNCTFSGNSARAGGALYNGTGFSLLQRCTFLANTAQQDGGAIIKPSRGQLLAFNCLFVGNQAGEQAGVIDLWGHSLSQPSVLRLFGCTLTANTAPFGSVLVCDSSDHEYPSDVTISNCILWNGGDEVWNNDGSTVTITYSDVQGGWVGEDNIDEDPLFAGGDDSHLLPDSPCINAGDNYAPDLQEDDIEGAPRIQNCRVDMGAYESPHPPIEYADCNDNGEDDDCDIYDGTSTDCNYNRVPDDCDIADGSSYDWNDNGLPDECECQGLQCCELLPDQPACLGDVNGDGSVNSVDVGTVKAAFGTTSDESLCRFDVNCNGTIDSIDAGLVLVYQGPCGADSLPPCYVSP